jgi:hypothetical protein
MRAVIYEIDSLVCSDGRIDVIILTRRLRYSRPIYAVKSVSWHDGFSIMPQLRDMPMYSA